MSNIAELYQKANDRFEEKVRGIRDDQWTDWTPCTEWNVRALVHHLVSENAWIPPLLEGRTIGEVGDALDGDLLGEDAKAAWQLRADAARAAVGEDGALDRIVHISRGDVPGGEYVFEVLADLTIHGWDLARALGVDETIDPDLLEPVYAYYEPLMALLKAGGGYGPQVEAPPDADRQTKLLAMLGRKSF